MWTCGSGVKGAGFVKRMVFLLFILKGLLRMHLVAGLSHSCSLYPGKLSLAEYPELYDVLYNLVK